MLVSGTIDHSAMRGTGEGIATGVWGASATGNGMRAVTGSSSNAAISALSPSSTGLAYWGTGNLTISGSAGTKAGGGTWAVLSDGRLKKDVKDFRSGLDGLEKIRPVTFKYNGLAGTENHGLEHVGVVAQELEKVFPSMVTTQKRKLRQGDAEETDVKVVDGNAFTYMLINAVKEQQEIIETQERRIAALERPRTSLSASALGGGLGLGLVFGLLPVAFFASRRRKGSPVNDA
jgi:trimeric autotransporter adhesin